jgi:hypothetical protein
MLENSVGLQNLPEGCLFLADEASFGLSAHADSTSAFRVIYQAAREDGMQ